jgi:hypothetical protein
MNDRIEALKKLATKEVWRENQYNGAPEFDRYELDADMFAELIVRDCDRYARSTWEHGELLGGDLKRLFGFEE